MSSVRTIALAASAVLGAGLVSLVVVTPPQDGAAPAGTEVAPVDETASTPREEDGPDAGAADDERGPTSGGTDTEGDTLPATDDDPDPDLSITEQTIRDVMESDQQRAIDTYNDAARRDD